MGPKVAANHKDCFYCNKIDDRMEGYPCRVCNKYYHKNCLQGFSGNLLEEFIACNRTCKDCVLYCSDGNEALETCGLCNSINLNLLTNRCKGCQKHYHRKCWYGKGNDSMKLRELLPGTIPEGERDQAEDMETDQVKVKRPKLSQEQGAKFEEAADWLCGFCRIGCSSSQLVRSRDLRIYHLNIRGLNGKISAVANLLDEFKIDVLCLSETKLASKDADPKINGYYMERFDRQHGGNASRGIVFYIKDDLSYEVARQQDEGEAIQVANLKLLLTSSYSMHLVCVYRPPGPNHDAFLTRINPLLNRLPSTQELVVLGDFNFPDIENRERLIGLFGRRNMYQLIKQPTRSARIDSNFLDLLFYNRLDYCAYTGTFDARLQPGNRALSDHSGIFLIRKCFK